jgi:hypothetical protein
MQAIFRDGKLAITASETSSRNDFDYLVGKWTIRNRTLKEQLSGSDSLWRVRSDSRAAMPNFERLDSAKPRVRCYLSGVR